nr:MULTISPECIES: HAD family hydrolase [unclassified Butyricicoccus]
MKYFVFDIDGTLIDSSKVDQWRCVLRLPSSVIISPMSS